MTDKITYNKGNYSFSNKAINQYITFFNNEYKTNIIINNDDNNDITQDDTLLSDSQNIDLLKENFYLCHLNG